VSLVEVGSYILRTIVCDVYDDRICYMFRGRLEASASCLVLKVPDPKSLRGTDHHTSMFGDTWAPLLFVVSLGVSCTSKR